MVKKNKYKMFSCNLFNYIYCYFNAMSVKNVRSVSIIAVVFIIRRVNLMFLTLYFGLFCIIPYLKVLRGILATYRQAFIILTVFLFLSSVLCTHLVETHNYFFSKVIYFTLRLWIYFWNLFLKLQINICLYYNSN